MARVTITTSGADKIRRKLGKKAARELTRELDRVIEANSLKIVNNAKENAPIKTGALKRSIKIYEKPAEMERIIGSNMPYATKQEYEHKTKKGYFRRAVWGGKEPLRKDIELELRKHGR